MKKLIALILALALICALFAGCSKNNDAAENKTIIIGASSTPHAEILEAVKEDLAKQGYTLDIRVFNDYVTPNTALQDGELDANYFQHTPYLNSFNAEYKTTLASAALIHYEPFGLYGNGVASVSDAKPGATIIVPADGSNETRALFLLQQEGLIKLADGATVEAGVTVYDIVEDNGYVITPVNAETVPAQFQNSDAGTLAVVNGNYALEAGMKVSDALAVEDASGEAAQTYANIIAVRAGDEKNEKIRALIKALQTDKVKDYINSTYNGAVVPIF